MFSFVFQCLISNVAFGFGCAYFSHYEESGIGAQWNNIWESPLLDDKVLNLLHPLAIEVQSNAYQLAPPSSVQKEAGDHS